jgi:hypothetical protein
MPKKTNLNFIIYIKSFLETKNNLHFYSFAVGLRKGLLALTEDKFQ